MSAKSKKQATDQATKSLVGKGLVFGSDEARSLTNSQSYLHLDFKKDLNVFVLANAMFCPERVHYAKIGKEVMRAVCGVHSTDDMQAVVSGRGEDHCPQCAEIQKVWQAWREAKANGDKIWQDELKTVAKEYGSVLSYYFVGASIEYELRKSGGKTIVKPYVQKGEKLKWTLLGLTADTFKKFQSAYEEAQLDSKDLIGCPVVFHIGATSDGSTYRSVQSIEILSKNRIEVPINTGVSFDNLGVVDSNALENMAMSFSSELETILAGEKKNTKKSPAKKKSANKKK
jgi:hypothetical protein